MENNQNNYRINPAVAIATLLQLIFVIFSSITIYNVLNRDVETPKIKIDNYSAISSGQIIGGANTLSNPEELDFTLDDNAKKVIESTIYDIVSLNNKGDITNYGAKIRKDSAHYIYMEELNGYFLHFIVDIEDLSQSYHFAWIFNNDSSRQKDPKVEPLMAFCPKKDEMIYGNFDCMDNYSGRGLDIIVYYLLRYKMFSSFTVGLSNIQTGEPLTFSINISSDDEAVENEAIQEIANYLANLGFNLDDFEYTIKHLEVAK